jgi:hypothetical protein
VSLFPEHESDPAGHRDPKYEQASAGASSRKRVTRLAHGPSSVAKLDGHVAAMEQPAQTEQSHGEHRQVTALRGGSTPTLIIC